MSNLKKFRKEEALLFWGILIICLSLSVISILSLINQTGNALGPVSGILAFFGWLALRTLIKAYPGKKEAGNNRPIQK